MNKIGIPHGFRSVTGNVGIRDIGDDFMAVISDVPAILSAVFTRSRFAGPSVQLSRLVAENHSSQGIIVISKNANVATGAKGLNNAKEVRSSFAQAVGMPPESLLIASTGVIGRQYPMANIRAYLEGLRPPFPNADFPKCARAMMTTDTKPKYVVESIGHTTLVGIAKGVGMIEPNMATLLAFFFTDAEISWLQLDAVFRRVINRTFNALSIDTDTSTSDSAAIFANGLAGPVDMYSFEQTLYRVALMLVRKIASDGEGASKILEIRVTGARDDEQAKRVAKSVVNSPLVKTAIHGADPNWGRVIMAIGKCEEDYDILPEKIRILFGETEVYPKEVDEAQLKNISRYLRNSEVVIKIDLNISSGSFTAYGCDLSEAYVHLNASYTT